MPHKCYISKLIRWLKLLAGLVYGTSFAQNNALILYNSPYITLKGGSSATPINLIIKQTNAAGITLSGTTNNGIISESEFNYVNWAIGTSTGTYTIPFYDITHTTSIPFSMLIGTAASVAGYVLFSTYTASGTLTPYATYDGIHSIPNMNLEYTAGTDNSANVVQRWWIIDAASYDSYTSFVNRPSNLTFTFEFNNAEIHGQTLGALDIQPFEYNASLTEWNPAIAFAQASSEAGTRNQVVSPSIGLTDFFRAWVLVNKTELLPIELLSFNAVCDDEKVNLNWATASETNNDYFTIEHSKDAQTWETVAVMPGAGNSNSTLNYSAIDNQPFSGYTYYRLKQTDYNGNYTYSDIVSVSCSIEDQLSMVVSQTDYGVNLLITPPGNDKNIALSVFDISGKMLFYKHISAIDNQLTISPDIFSNGIYIFRLQSETDNVVQKVMIR